MSVALVLLALLTLVAGLCAALLPRLVHAALAFAVAFLGVAGFYFLLGAEFVGLVQIFVYIGAVAVLIVFTILLTRRNADKDRGYRRSGALVAVAVFAVLSWAIVNSSEVKRSPPATAPVTVKEIGQALMTHYVWPLQITAVLLTVALLGALILAMEDKR
jgi:NADH-quinone oxidoreductase subunit J